MLVKVIFRGGCLGWNMSVRWGINMYVCWIGLVLYEGVMGLYKAL